MPNITFKTTVEIDGIEHMTRENKTAIMDFLIAELSLSQISEWLEHSEYSNDLRSAARTAFSKSEGKT